MIPIGTDYRRRTTPWVNYGIIAVNVILYLLGCNANSAEHMAQISGYMLEPDLPRLSQFFTCMFLHADLWHLLGNMVFLWVFGNAVNDKLGHVSYLAFYLAGGVLAGVGYLLLSGNAPVLGASGAIAGVAGAFLVLLPRTRISVIFLLGWYPLPAQLSSLIFVAIHFGFDLIMTVGVMTGPGAGGVAYAAHATGYLYGGLIAAGLLVSHLMPRDAYDLLNIIRHRRRRAAFQRMAIRGYDPYAVPRRMRTDTREAPAVVRTLQVGSDEHAPDSVGAPLRQRIAKAYTRHDLDTAAEAYRQLQAEHPQAVLPRQQQLDIANQLMAREHYAAAADAYEKFLASYQDYPYIADIHLMLGLLYARYLGEPAQAEPLLAQALDALADPRKRSLAEASLAQARRDKGC